MNLRDKLAGEIDDPVLAEALEHFKASVNAWSEAAYSRPRTVAERRRGIVAAGGRLGAGMRAGGGQPGWRRV